ncbi:uncharacterized protein LOC122309528 [Carya illinoinensis]|uniref:uncharacterized protein LOC122309528 n=1 Tax=Carya illinoinensis TaxID=32201 RepID=UPI001C71FBCD|nr:uncharacterized protein LOC122309528 [Carya illinoinensis]
MGVSKFRLQDSENFSLDLSLILFFYLFIDSQQFYYFSKTFSPARDSRHKSVNPPPDGTHFQPCDLIGKRKSSPPLSDLSAVVKLSLQVKGSEMEDNRIILEHNLLEDDDAMTNQKLEGLRLPCLYFGCYEGGIEILVQVSLFCLGNMLKWVVCVIYFYDCKKRTLEKKFDEEVGREIKAVDASLSWEEKKYRESVPNSVYLLLATFYIDLFSRNRDKPWIFAVLYPEFVAIRCL